MKILIAKRGGCCYGVERALEIAHETAESAEGPIRTLGPIIHNPGVVEELDKEGVSVAKELSEIGEGTVIFRTHGVPPEVADQAEKMGLKIVDATCPYVKVAQEKALSLKKQGYKPIILGEHDHPEVVAIRAYAGEESISVENVEELDPDLVRGKVGVVVQTTQSGENLAALAALLAPRCRELLIYNTMCNSTRKSQEEALDLAEAADVVIVIGGRNSANTTRLAQLCRKVQPRTHHIEDIAELQRDWFEAAETVAITAGASTPSEQMDAAAAWLRHL